MKKLVNYFVSGVVSVLGAMWLMGVIIMFNLLVEWVTVNNIRFVIFVCLGVWATVALLHKELER